MRLTYDLIVNAEQFVGPNKARVLSLRGFKLPAVENIGATNDHYDIIDLSDNDILRLDHFPPLTRLDTLVVANNRIRRLDPHLMESLPNLKSLVLTNNKLSSLADLTPLFKAKNLERLAILDNPVVSKPHYRELLIFSIKSIRFIDFKHVKDVERLAAKKLFSGPSGSALLHQLCTKDVEELPTETDDPTQKDAVKQVDITMRGASESDAPTQISPELETKLREAISQAATLAEVQRLEEVSFAGIRSAVRLEGQQFAPARLGQRAPIS